MTAEETSNFVSKFIEKTKFCIRIERKPRNGTLKEVPKEMIFLIDTFGGRCYNLVQCDLETYRSGHNENDSKSFCPIRARGFESLRLRYKPLSG